MNITNDKAGAVSHEHILKRGFKVFETIEGSDMGQMSWSMPQFKNDKIRILGGYWNYVIKPLNSNKTIWEGWWNSNEEFDETINEINKVI